LQAIAGSPFAPPASQVVTLLAAPAGATLTGVRLLPAGRLGSGWLLVREAAAMAPPVPAGPDAVWDGRFRLGRGAAPQEGTTFGAVGGDAAKLRRHSMLPAAVLRTLPALRRGATLLAVPHLHYPERKACEGLDVVFSPPRPAVAAPYRFGDA
jgi:tRNA(Ile)-lysidine synthase